MSVRGKEEGERGVQFIVASLVDSDRWAAAAGEAAASAETAEGGTGVAEAGGGGARHE